MPLEALLTFIGLLLAALAIARPVQRHSLTLFAPAWILALGCLGALIFIIFRDAPFGVPPPFGWRLDAVTFFLTLGAFALPVATAIVTWASWDRAELTPKRLKKLEGLLRVALREGEFDEVERILRKKRNRRNLNHLPHGAASVLFHPTMVAALVEANSFIHLELIANMDFLKSLKNRFSAVDTIVRELMRSDVSPLRSVVGGVEHPQHSDDESKLVERTFGNPKWYLAAAAHYPLVIVAVEKLHSGQFDSRYNAIDRNYETKQGVSTRSNCPIYLAAKIEVIAIEAALDEKVEDDFYVTDLWDIFRRVQERSIFDSGVWQSNLGNWEYPTPYAYLLHMIAFDLRRLAEHALRGATLDGTPSWATRPGLVASQIAQTWALCLWSLARSEGQVSPQFREYLIADYLVFLLCLHGAPSEIYHQRFGGSIEGLDAWRDLFLSELQKHFLVADSVERASLQAAFNSLDQGKGYVFNGADWLEAELFQ